MATWQFSFIGRDDEAGVRSIDCATGRALIEQGCMHLLQPADATVQHHPYSLPSSSAVMSLRISTMGWPGKDSFTYDTYGMGDVEDAGFAIDRVDRADWFHSNFWAASFTNRKNSLYPDEPAETARFYSVACRHGTELA